MITNDLLKKIYPHSTEQNRQKYLPFLNQYMAEYGIDTYPRVCAFLAQIGHESGQLTYSEEIASGKAYEGRKDLGNISKGDGMRFKGRGLIQITGRANYKQISDAFRIDFLANPQLLSTPDMAVKSACWWWTNRNLNQYATLKEDDFKKITKIINGGYNGYADRKQLWDNARNVLALKI